eukprot:RCo033084
MADYLHRVDGIVMLDADGKRLFAKYWGAGPLDNRSKQAAFEKTLFSKTSAKRSSPAGGDKAEQPEKSSDLKTLISLTRSAEKEPSPSGSGEAGDILLMENHTVLYRFDEEVYYYVIGGAEENEVVLFQVLCCFYDSLGQLLKHSVEKKSLLENYELIILVCDEMIDDGIILEINPQSIFNEVSPHASLEADSPLGALQTMAKIVKQNL